MIYVENHAEECVELCVGQRLGTVHSMCIVKEAWIRAELMGLTTPELDKEEVEVIQVNSVCKNQISPLKRVREGSSGRVLR